MARQMLGRAAVVVLLLAAVVAFGAERKFEKKFEVKPGGVLKLTTDIGSVRVTAGSGTGVQVTAEIRGRESDVQEFEVTAEQRGNDVEVEGRARKSGFWHNMDLDVTYTVVVPKEYGAAVKTSGGDVEVKGTKGDVRAETSGGDLVVRDVAGMVDARTSGGNVEGTNVAGDLHMSTSGGDIKVRNVTGVVDVSTSGGNVSVTEIRGKVTAETSGGDVSVGVVGDFQGVHAETSGGNITIGVGKKVGAEIDASTSGGEVECELPLTVQGKLTSSKIRGTVNGGGALIKARTTGGDITIRGAE